MKINFKQFKLICDKLNFRLIKPSFIGAGSHNECYKINTDKGDYVIKVASNSEQLKKEFKMLGSLDKDIAPKVYFFDDSKNIIPFTYLVEEFVQGIHPPKKASSKFIVAMANWYKKLHLIKSDKIPKSEMKIIFSMSYWCNLKYEKFNLYKKELNNLLANRIENIFIKSLNVCKSNDSLFVDRKEFTLNQNDPSNDNIFFQGSKIRLIDWEFAGYGLYERDILTFFKQYQLNSIQRSLFLKIYKYPKTEIAKKRLNVLKIILSLSDISYLVQRIDSLKDKKMNMKQKLSKRKSLLTRLNKIIKIMEKERI